VSGTRRSSREATEDGGRLAVGKDEHELRETDIEEESRVEDEQKPLGFFFKRLASIAIPFAKRDTNHDRCLKLTDAGQEAVGWPRCPVTKVHYTNII